MQGNMYYKYVNIYKIIKNYVNTGQVNILQAFNDIGYTNGAQD